MLIVLLGVMRYLFGNKEVMFGANGNAMSYINDVHPNKYKSVDEALLDVDEKVKSEKQLYRDWETDRKSTRLNSSHITRSRMPSSA